MRDIWHLIVDTPGEFDRGLQFRPAIALELGVEFYRLTERERQLPVAPGDGDIVAVVELVAGFEELTGIHSRSREPPSHHSNRVHFYQPDRTPTRMFEAIVSASTLQDALDSVSVLVDECKIRLEEDGLAIRAVDPANVGMVDLTLDAAAFESYEADGGVIGVNLTRLENIAGMANNDDLVHLELDEETRMLHIRMDGLSYTLALIDPDSIREEPDIPDLDLSAEIVAEGAQIDRGITAADMVSDHIRLRVDAETEVFVIEAEGDTDDVNLDLGRDELIDLKPGDADSLFSLDYLKDMNKAIPKDAEVTIELGEEFPVKLHYGFAEGGGQVTYMLAPRIQSD